MWITRFELDLTGNAGLPEKYPTQNLWPRDTIINNERQFYVDPRLVDDVILREENGLVIRARRRRFGEDYTDQEWVSGMFTSFGVEGGSLNPNFRERILIRMKLPVGVGAWPAGWLLPHIKQKADGSPDWTGEEGVLAEVDAVEYLTHNPHVYYSTVHTRDNPTGVLNSDRYRHNCPAIALPTDFHTWGFERDGDTSRWAFDSLITKEFKTPQDLKHRPLFFLINLAIGGNWSEQWSENWPPSAQYYRLQIASVTIQRWEDDPILTSPGSDTDVVPPTDDVDLGDPGSDPEPFNVLTDPSHPNYSVANDVRRQVDRYCDAIRDEAMVAAERYCARIQAIADERIKELQ